tara:strand:+ start:5029 stop:6327 length:1299 start_codon:yes stop_codon:yes gene_type:complete
MKEKITYHLVTLGCPKNDVDSLHLERLLETGDLAPTKKIQEADSIIVNTCGFIEQSKAQSIETVRELAKIKKANQKLIVAGCLTQIAAEEVQESEPLIDHIFGVGEWEAVAKTLGVGNVPIHDIPKSAVKVTGPSAYLKISDGCNAPCTFCVIPKIKGALKSASVGRLVDESHRLVEAGAKELVLVAQDSTAWGEDLGIKNGLPELLKILGPEVGPDVWLRLMYAYPSRVRPPLIEAMAEIPNVIPYLDVPLQHGSENMLRKMRRPWKSSKTREMIANLRDAIPEITLRTSLIVGFPGESDDDIAELLEFLEEIMFDHVGVFTYSQQKWTPAGEYNDQIIDSIKNERRDLVMQLQQKISEKRASRFIGKTMSMLIEGNGESDNGDPIAIGRTVREAPEVDGLVFAQGQAKIGSKVKVKIEDSGEYDLFGRLL